LAQAFGFHPGFLFGSHPALFGFGQEAFPGVCFSHCAALECLCEFGHVGCTGPVGDALEPYEGVGCQPGVKQLLGAERAGMPVVYDYPVFHCFALCDYDVAFSVMGSGAVTWHLGLVV
jgi:hypothetical protein